MLVTIPASTQGARHNKEIRENRDRESRFTSHLLNDLEFVSMINREISSFLYINQNTANPNIVWDAMKAYLRGQTIAYASSKHKKYKEKIQSLENKIKDLEKQDVQTQDSNVLQQLKTKQLEYNMLNTHKTENAIKRMKHRYYEQGDKAGKLSLAD